MTITLDGTNGITNASSGTVLDTTNIATYTEAITGTVNTTLMTPLRTYQAIDTRISTSTAALSAGAIGTYMYAVIQNSTVYAFGATVSGSLLRACGSFTYDATSGIAAAQTLGTTPSGTWRLMGGCGFVYGALATLWLRIA